MAQGLTVFQTSMGAAGIAWTDAGISGVELPVPSAAMARARLCRRFPGHVESPPPPSVQQAIEAITALLSGDLTADLSEIQLDLSDVSPFESRVYAEARTIAAGETLTYGAIATRLGGVRLAREVGQALGRNPFPIIVPCHRVIAANGRLGGFSARGGITTKQRLLSLERADVGWQLALET